MLELKEVNPRRNEKWLHTQHSRKFVTWVEKEVDRRVNNGENICQDVRWLAKLPNFVVKKYGGYAINEYKFHTTAWDESKTTQGSGVSLVANAMQVASEKDPNPVYGAVTYYGRIKEIWELDYYMLTVPIFMCEWVDIRGITKDDLGFTTVNFQRLGSQTERFILASQPHQVFYVEDQENEDLSVVGVTPHKMFKYGLNGEDEMYEFNATGSVEQDDFDLDDDFVCVRPDGEGTLV